jgi:ubiquitin-like protein Pup
MSSQETSGHRRSRPQEDVEDVAPAPAAAEKAEKTVDDVDALLDEIDDVLEENAEEFVRAYVQKGGQ